MHALKAVAKRKITAEEFISSYEKGRRDFSNSDLSGEKFEICTSDLRAKPIVFENINCSNSVFYKTLFNSVVFKEATFSGSILDHANFVSCKIIHFDANVSTWIKANIYNTDMYRFDLRYSRLFGLDVELSTILPNGLMLGKNNITYVKLLQEQCNNSGIENIKIEDVIIASSLQESILSRAGVDTKRVAIVDTEPLIALRRINNPMINI